LLLLDSLAPEKSPYSGNNFFLVEAANLMNTGGVYVENPVPERKKLPWENADGLALMKPGSG
jgi:hypothetical protein